MARDRIQNIFLHMKDRCYNPNFRDYKNYGGRGITICEEWQTPHSWKGGRAFRKWALENGYADNLTLDRIDVNKGYSSENCRWVSMKTQQNNKRNNRLITYNGKTQTIALWCEELKLPFSTVKNRLNKGYPVEKIFSKTNLIREISADPERRRKISERVRAFMADPVKKAEWQKSLAKRYKK